MIHSIQKALWACVLAGGLANAEIWESTVSLNQLDVHYVWFDTTNRTMTTEYNGEYRNNELYGFEYVDVPDIVIPEILTGPWSMDYSLVSFFDFVHYEAFSIGAIDLSSSNEILFIQDTASLDFSNPLPLEAEYLQKNILINSIDAYEYIYLLGFGLNTEKKYWEYHTQENFLFQIHSGYYALCHLTLYVYRDEHGVLSHFSPHQLTCAVQTDGTTKFDSLPWHPDPVSVLPSVRSPKLKPRNTGSYYGADGARIQSPQRWVWQVLGE